MLRGRPYSTTRRRPHALPRQLGVNFRRTSSTRKDSQATYHLRKDTMETRETLACLVGHCSLWWLQLPTREQAKDGHPHKAIYITICPKLRWVTHRQPDTETVG